MLRYRLWLFLWAAALVRPEPEAVAVLTPLRFSQVVGPFCAFDDDSHKVYPARYVTVIPNWACSFPLDNEEAARDACQQSYRVFSSIARSIADGPDAAYGRFYVVICDQFLWELQELWEDEPELAESMRPYATMYREICQSQSTIEFVVREALGDGSWKPYFGPTSAGGLLAAVQRSVKAAQTDHLDEALALVNQNNFADPRAPKAPTPQEL